MRIEFVSSAPAPLRFCDIAVGQVFSYEGAPENVYIKTNDDGCTNLNYGGHYVGDVVNRLQTVKVLANAVLLPQGMP